MKKLKQYLKNVKKELKKVKWPTGRELLKGIITTLVFCIFFAGFFYLINVLFALLKGLF